VFGFLLIFVFIFGLREKELRQWLCEDLFHGFHPENNILLCVEVARVAIANAIKDNFQNDQHDIQCVFRRLVDRKLESVRYLRQEMVDNRVDFLAVIGKVD
jgi:hypothetical protein